MDTRWIYGEKLEIHSASLLGMIRHSPVHSEEYGMKLALKFSAGITVIKLLHFVSFSPTSAYYCKHKLKNTVIVW